MESSVTSAPARVIGISSPIDSNWKLLQVSSQIPGSAIAHAFPKYTPSPARYSVVSQKCICPDDFFWLGCCYHPIFEN
jgi:hypothetical protein